MDRALFEELGLHQMFGEKDGECFFFASVNGRATSDIDHSTQASGDNLYRPCAESTPAPNTPAGTIHVISDWRCDSFPGTSRALSIYTPANLSPQTQCSLLVCFDGSAYLNPEGDVKAARVLDTLIHRGDIPPTLAIFVDPGIPDGVDLSQLAEAGVNDSKCKVIQQRSDEYDRLCDQNARFVINELIPTALKQTGITLSEHAHQRAVCGMSSGGIAAFTVAWRFPEYFGVVISHCGSYVNIRGGHHYPYLVRTTPRKALRVYLQSGEQDANITLGSWPLANQQMAAALEFSGYDHVFEFGSGGHTLRHAGALFADTLRWSLG